MGTVYMILGIIAGLAIGYLMVRIILWVIAKSDKKQTN